MTTRISSGNTFHGRIKEFPGLGVDKFNTDCDVYLLTHCHEDHLVGLKTKSFSSRIYCSTTTRDMIRVKQEYRAIVPYLNVMEDLVNILVKGRDVHIAMIPAYHCPGAVMFLVQDSVNAVLITGDIRAESWWVDSLRKNQYLFPFTTGLKTLDNIYLDTSFGYRGEPFIEMLQNTEGIEAAIHLLKAYPLDDEEIQYHFVDPVLGSEEAWAQIVDFFKGALVIGKDIKKRMVALCKDRNIPYSTILGSIMSRTQHPRFYSCARTARPPLFGVRIKQCIDFNVVDYSGVFLPIALSTISSQEPLTKLGCTKRGNTIYQFRERRWIFPANTNELLPDEIKLVFSRHSSYSESRNLVTLFKPVQVYPCCSSKESWFNGFTMARMFGDLCSHNRQFDYDLMMFKQWGHPSSSVIDRPVKTIDRWNLQECHDEIEFVKEVQEQRPKPLQNFKFKGQHQVSAFKRFQSADDRNLKIGRAKDMLLQNIIAGRGEARYKHIIETHQRQYSELSRYFPERCPRGYENDSNFDESEEFSYDLDSNVDSLKMKETHNIHEEDINHGNQEVMEKNSDLRKIDAESISSVTSHVSESDSDCKHTRRPRPTLKRKSKTQLQNHQKSLRIRSSFDSQEVSFTNLYKESASENDLPFWKTSLSHISKTACTTIDHKHIESISALLRKDPGSWFSMNLKSAHISRTPSF